MVGKLKAVVGLDSFHADAPALEPHNGPLEKIGGGVSALLLIGPKETQAGELIGDGILEEAQLRICDIGLGLPELWYRLRKRGYTRRPESLFRVMRKLGMTSQPKPKESYKPRPYEQMTHPGRRVQIDVKVMPSA